MSADVAPYANAPTTILVYKGKGILIGRSPDRDSTIRIGMQEFRIDAEFEEIYLTAYIGVSGKEVELSVNGYTALKDMIPIHLNVRESTCAARHILSSEDAERPRWPAVSTEIPPATLVSSAHSPQEPHEVLPAARKTRDQYTVHSHNRSRSSQTRSRTTAQHSKRDSVSNWRKAETGTPDTTPSTHNTRGRDNIRATVPSQNAPVPIAGSSWNLWKKASDLANRGLDVTGIRHTAASAGMGTTKAATGGDADAHEESHSMMQAKQCQLTIRQRREKMRQEMTRGRHYIPRQRPCPPTENGDHDTIDDNVYEPSKQFAIKQAELRAFRADEPAMYGDECLQALKNATVSTVSSMVEAWGPGLLMLDDGVEVHASTPSSTQGSSGPWWARTHARPRSSQEALSEIRTLNQQQQGTLKPLRLAAATARQAEAAWNVRGGNQYELEESSWRRSQNRSRKRSSAPRHNLPTIRRPHQSSYPEDVVDDDDQAESDESDDVDQVRRAPTQPKADPTTSHDVARTGPEQTIAGIDSVRHAQVSHAPVSQMTFTRDVHEANKKEAAQPSRVESTNRQRALQRDPRGHSILEEPASNDEKSDFPTIIIDQAKYHTDAGQTDWPHSPDLATLYRESKGCARGSRWPSAPGNRGSVRGKPCKLNRIWHEPNHSHTTFRQEDRSPNAEIPIAKPGKPRPAGEGHQPPLEERRQQGSSSGVFAKAASMAKRQMSTVSRGFRSPPDSPPWTENERKKASGASNTNSSSYEVVKRSSLSSLRDFVPAELPPSDSADIRRVPCKGSIHHRQDPSQSAPQATANRDSYSEEVDVVYLQRIVTDQANFESPNRRGSQLVLRAWPATSCLTIEWKQESKIIQTIPFDALTRLRLPGPGNRFKFVILDLSAGKRGSILLEMDRGMLLHFQRFVLVLTGGAGVSIEHVSESAFERLAVEEGW